MPERKTVMIPADQDPLNSQSDLLISIQMHEFFKSLGNPGLPPVTWLLRRMITPVTRHFAGIIMDFDRCAADKSLQAAAGDLLMRCINSIRVLGIENIPSEGPTVILSNHPGLTDTLALIASIPRPDLHIVAQERPFLRALKATSRRLIFVSPDNPGRTETLRKIVTKLREGEAVLSFPSGHVEPDPAVMPGARRNLETWSESAAVFLRSVADLKIVPALVSGVIHPTILHHPLVYLRKHPVDRWRMAATLQILAVGLTNRLGRVNLTLTFGQPLRLDRQSAQDRGLVRQALTDQVGRLMETVQAG